MNDEFIDILEWLIQVQPIFYTVLYRSLNRRMEAPLYMRKINDNGIQEIFKIYAKAKDDYDQLNFQCV